MRLHVICCDALSTSSPLPSFHSPGVYIPVQHIIKFLVSLSMFCPVSLCGSFPFLSLPSNPSWQVASWALFSQVFLLVKREFFKVLAHRGLFKCQRFHQNTIGALPYSIKHFFFKHTNFRMKQVTFLGVLFYSWQSNSSTLMYCVYSSLLHGIWHFTMHYLWPFLWLFEESKKITFQPNLSMN